MKLKPKRVLSLLLLICLVVGFVPTTAFAADGDKAVMLGTSGIEDPTADGNTYYTPNSYIYFGMNGSDPIKWRVLDADKANDRNTNGMFLLSEYLLERYVSFDDEYFSNDYQNSNAHEWCKTFASNLSNFSAAEQNAMMGVAKEDVTESSLYLYKWGTSSLTTDDKMFFLSARELADYVGNYDKAPGLIAKFAGGNAYNWWLRSPNPDSNNAAGMVSSDGFVKFFSVENDLTARPAFNLNLNSVLFTSAAEGGKSASGMDGGLTSIDDYSGNEWKLTLLDENRKFSIYDAVMNRSGDAISFYYSNAQTGENEYISVVIVDNNAVTHYGRILHLDGTSNGADGKASLKLPVGVTLSDTAKLYVFNEQYNGGENDNTKQTDYGSRLIDVQSAFDTTAPKLTDGSAVREFTSTATIKFTSDEAGEYYYEVVESGENEPDIDTSKPGAYCAKGENAITITNLLDAGAKDVYIAVKDAADNVSQTLKITIPEYIAPSYGISVSPAALNFGSKTAGYTEAPDAQKAVLTNTGNQNITVNLPTSTNYTITAGEGFTDGAVLLEPDGTAEFTVQPNTGLGAGNYNETLTISGTESVRAQVVLSFAVVETEPDTYTLTVDLNGGSGSTAGGEYEGGRQISIDAGTRSGYSFSGWTSSNGGTFADASSASTTFIMPNGDTTITANWKKKSSGSSSPSYYFVTFNTNGGEDMDKELKEEYTGIDLDDYVPEREGYKFVGWYADEDLTKKIEEVYLTKDTTIYAKWEKIEEEDTENSDEHNETEEITGESEENETVSFTDVKESDWFYNAVTYAADNGLMSGMGGGRFSPNTHLQREMLAVILWNMEGKPKQNDTAPFIDVAGDKYYAKAIAWANENGIAAGYGDTFGVGEDITREEFAAILYRYAQSKGYDTAQGGMAIREYSDYEGISDYAMPAMAWAVNAGIIGGMGDGSLNPQGKATRAEAAVILMNFCENIVK